MPEHYSSNYSATTQETTSVTPQENNTEWFVLRDLTRPIAKVPGYQKALAAGFEVFTPMKWVIRDRNGKRVREQIPMIHDLLFVHAARERLDTLINSTDTLQYRYAKGLGYCVPMTVRDVDMQRFIAAVSAKKDPHYYTADELTHLSYGRRIRLVCQGPLNGYEGKLLRVKGGRKKRLLVALPGLLAVEYEISPDFIQFID